ncbi:hypothetical protein [Parasynechococcus sp.]|uniref:hypothetical protein n=1 Tax=Parasynechococcus sp. TaxID=3101203 RepID=UPI0037046FC7
MFHTATGRLTPINAGHITHTPAGATGDADKDTITDGTHIITGRGATDTTVVHAIDIDSQITLIVIGALATKSM